MNRTEEIERLKKEMFQLQLKMKLNSDKENILETSLLIQKLDKKIRALELEEKNANGQVSFAFTDLIENEKI